VGEWLLRALAALVGRLPWRALKVPGAALGWIAGDLLRIRRGHVENSMRAAGIVDSSKQARAMYASLGTSAMEFLWSTSRGGEAAERVAIDDASAHRWRAALGRGRGVVIAASHTGNWDLAASAMARDIELLVVTKHLSVLVLDRFWQSTRARAGVHLADAPGAMGRGREVLRRRGAVAMMIDQAPSASRHAVAVEFLGRRAFADRAPAALAAASGAPLVVAAGSRDDSGAHVLHVLKVFVPPRRPTRRWISETTSSATRALDEFVRARPSQWLWLHRRWKSPFAGSAAPSRPGVDPGGRTARLARS
jgi:KDO2-lipid IV(A) lauroyltransferase